MNNSVEMTLNKMVLNNDPVEIEKVIQTTPSQMEIWLACKIGGKEANMAYNESLSIQLKGSLSVKSLQEAFLKIIQRHDAMRAIISENGKHQIILSSYELPIRLRDISEMTAEDKEKFLKKHSLETGNYQFNLTQGPLYVMELIKLDGMHHQLTFTGHHIIFDGWSLSVMLDELGSLYSSIVSEQESTLETPDSLSEYSVELIKKTRKSSYAETRKFWTKYLSNPVADMRLPLDKPRPKYRTYACERLEVVISKELLAKTKAFASSQRVSLNHTLLSVFELFLSDWTKQDDVVVGLPVAGQLLENKPNLIGHSVHLLPLRSRLNTDQTFLEYLQERRRSFIDTLDHQAISFGSMVQDLQIKRDPSRIPLVPLTFNIDMGTDNVIAFKGLEHKMLTNPKAYANFEIIVNLFGSSCESVFEWTYNKDLFDGASVAAAANRYLGFIEKFVENPEIKLGDLISYEPVQTAQAAVIAQDVDVEFVPFIRHIEANFDKLTNELAVHFNGEEISYQLLAGRSRSFAGFLRKSGIGPGDVVGLHIDRSPDLVAAMLGVLQAGAAYLTIETTFPEERVKFMLTDAGAKGFFSEDTTINWGELESQRLPLNASVFNSYSHEYRQVEISPSDPVYLVYTSGSTGTPKGVVLTQSNLFHFANHYEKVPGVNFGDRVLGVTSVSFDMHWLELVMPFAYGASLYLLDRFKRIDSREIIKVLEKHKINQLSSTPSHLRSLVTHGLNKKLEGLFITSVGEPLLLGLAESLLDVSDRVYNIYGPAEATLYVTLKKVERGMERMTVGKTVSGTTILIVDEKGHLVTEVGRVGEIIIGGPQVSAGYLNRPELNSDKFISDPFPTQTGRHYKTGDLGQWTEDGEILCLGRVDHQVKVRGQRVELGEIESKISLDTRVQHVAVFKLSDENDDDVLRAVVSLKDVYKNTDTQTWIEECKASLSKKVANYMVPSQYVMLDELPINANGKIDRNKIKSMDLKVTKIEVAPSTVAPTELTDAEMRVKALWEKVLHTKNAGLEENFFEVGGHSLLAVELISMIEKEFAINLPLYILFEYPSIKLIASQVTRLLHEESKSNSGCLVKIKDGDPRKVLYFIHGVGLNPIEINTLIQNMDADQTIWGLQSPAVADSVVAPMTNLEEIASYYINEIKAAGLKGPFNLMGNSFGGIIAFEMANQLSKAGERVSFLGMIDTVATLTEGRDKSFIGNIVWLVKKLAFEAKFILNDIPYYISFRKKYVREKWASYKEKTAQNQGTNLYSRIKHIERVNNDAWEKYQHQFVDSTITLFLADRKTFYVPDRKTFGWGPLCREVETLVMPGEHAEMLKPPHGVKFSRALQSKLNQINGVLLW